MSEQGNEIHDDERTVDELHALDPEAPADSADPPAPDGERIIGAEEGLVDTTEDPRASSFSEEEHRLAEENAATSLDQPSDSVE